MKPGPGPLSNPSAVGDLSMMKSLSIFVLAVLGASPGCRAVDAECDGAQNCSSTGCDGAGCDEGSGSSNGTDATGSTTEPTSGSSAETARTGSAGSDPDESSSSSGDADSSTGVVSGCFDGVLEHDELPLVPGASARFAVAVSPTYNSEGVLEDDGTYTWDLDVSLRGDEVVDSAVLSVEDFWFEENFPEATHALRLSVQSDVIAIFEATETAILTLGLASEDSGATQTLLIYDPPLPFHPLPLTSGTTWSSTSTVSGALEGVPVTFTEQREASVDKTGTMRTPRGSFEVLRINDLRTTSFGLAEQSTRSFFFMAECVGTVASIRAEDGNDAPELLQASEIWRASL